jgi:glycosyltransferase involved in cell wall biosynthesis
MRICQIGTGFMPVAPYVAGAVEGVIYHLSKNLAEMGQDVHVIDAKTLQRERECNFTLHEISSVSLSNHGISHVLKGISSGLLFFKCLHELEVKENFDVIHAHNQFSGFGALALTKLKRRAPFVYSVHNEWLWFPTPKGKLYSLLDAFIVKHADHITVPTPTFRETLANYYNVEQQKISVIPYGIDTSIANSYDYASQHEDGIILNVGRFTWRKNQLMLVKLMKKLVADQRDLTLILAGPIEDCNYFDAVHRYVIHAGLERNVIIKGEVNRHELISLYKKATIFAFPSLLETQGLAALEAMSFGLPAIISKTGRVGVAELLSHSNAIILADVRNEPEWLKYVNMLLDDKNLRIKISIKAKEYVKEHFDWKPISKMLLGCYETVLN